LPDGLPLGGCHHPMEKDDSEAGHLHAQRKGIT
jgi:hypothetical protein